MRIRVDNPTSASPYTVATVAIEGHVTNEHTQPVVGPNGKVVTIDARFVACREGQVTPPAPDPIKADQRDVDFAFPQVTFRTNGPYAVVIKATGSSTDGRTQSAQVVVPIKLAVPPKKPVDVEVSPPANGEVTVTWSTDGREPDLIAYEVRRAKQGSSEYVTLENGLVDPSVHAVTDAPAIGTWRYHVVAYRADVAEGAVSRDATVEVAEPAPAPSPGTGSSGGGTTGAAGPSSGSSTSTSGSAATASESTRTVDLSDFAAFLNARRAAPPKRVEPPDPGFERILPFAAGDELGVEDDPAEPGADAPDVGLGQARLAADPGERRRSLGFVAFGLLLFVLSMTGLFVKAEVKRADLEGLAPDDLVDADPEPTSAPSPPDDDPSATRNGHHGGFSDLADPATNGRPTGTTPAPRRRPDPPLDAPGLDIPDPPAPLRMRVSGKANPTR